MLYSKTLNRYYIGSTELTVEQRLILHLSKAYGNKKFTAKTDDWTVYLAFEFDLISQARKAERYLKKMRNRDYYAALKNDEATKERFLQKILTQ